MANFLQWLRTQWFPAIGHTPRETITHALQWQISTLLPSIFTLDWRLRCVLHLIRMEHIAPLTWSNIVHQTGSIFDPRGRCRRLLRLLALLVRIWSSHPRKTCSDVRREIPRQSENSRLIPVEMATPWLTDAWACD